MDDTSYYDLVAKELKESGPKAGLWLKSLTESNGDEKIAKPVYVKMRVEQLINEDNKKKELAERNRRREKLANIPQLSSKVRLLRLVLIFLGLILIAIIAIVLQ